MKNVVPRLQLVSARARARCVADDANYRNSFLDGIYIAEMRREQIRARSLGRKIFFRTLPIETVSAAREKGEIMRLKSVPFPFYPHLHTLILD